MKELIIEDLTPEAFAPFGDVIHPDTAQKNITINYGNTLRYHDLADIDTLQDGGKTVIKSNY